jgi:hypothetical protein
VNLQRAEKIANAVLYEGYMLYPYRPTSTKNRQRWNFGTLYPEQFDEVLGGHERCRMQTQCLLTAEPGAVLQVNARFLHLVERRVFAHEVPPQGDPAQVRPVQSLVVDGRVHESWEEGVERSVEASVEIEQLLQAPVRVLFSFPGSSEREALRESGGRVAGTVHRTQHSIDGGLELMAERLPEGVLRLTAQIVNQTPLAPATERATALLRSLLSAHTILGLGAGEFASLLDPPEHLREATAALHNIGTYPVLVGEAGEHDLLLSSPIILYDYPQVAPESAGDFFDGTEMDEMLTLRVLTMTDEEKREMAGADDRVRQLLERTEHTAREQLVRTHGVGRSLKPSEDDAA